MVQAECGAPWKAKKYAAPLVYHAAFVHAHAVVPAAVAKVVATAGTTVGTLV